MLVGAVLYAKDLSTLVAFYVALGGEVVDGEEGAFSTLRTDKTDLIVLQAPKHVADAIQIETPPKLRSATPIKPIFKVACIDSVLEMLPQIGGMVLPGAAQWAFKEHTVQDIVDPEGNVIQLWHS
ncbi:MAG: hypothetical protein ABJF50_08475 [Paracoccaceae bacterium]